MSAIVDGTSKTYMVGEKAMNPDFFETGWDPSDDQSLYIGADVDVLRSSLYQPRPDQPGVFGGGGFGSAHPGGWNVVLCDGSVHLVSYDIDADIHLRLGNREDGESVDLGGF